MNVYPPLSGRAAKPRRTGLTMVIDKGLGQQRTDDLLGVAAAYIDFIKLGFGTSMLYPSDVLKQKVSAIKDAGVEVYPGGTLLEVAVHQGRGPGFLQWCRAVGFTFIEVSDGTIELPPSRRSELIDRARELGFGVLSEVGKKDPQVRVDPARVAEQVESDLRAGVFKVIIEARDSGRGIGIYDGGGCLREELYAKLLEALDSVDDVIWEAPQTAQQQALLVGLGPNANFGNVQPEDVITLEAMRVGLRGDTLRLCIEKALPNRAGIRQTI